MQISIRTKVAAFVVAGACVLVGRACEVRAAIALNNDVGVGASQGDPDAPVFANAVVTGAPRLVTNTTLDSIEIEIETDGSIAPESVLTLIVYAAEGLQQCCEVRLRSEVLSTGKRRLVEFLPQDRRDTTLDPDEEENPFWKRLETAFIRGEVIFTLRGKIFVEPDPPASFVKITLTGGGHELIIDRVGDLNAVAGDALDVPPRSVDLLRTLSQFEDHGRRRGAELDEGGANRPVGFTHALDDASANRLDGATLHLSIRSNSRGIRDDFIVLDRGVGRHAKKRRSALIFLCHALNAKPVPSTEPLSIEIDLERAPVTFGAMRHGRVCDSAPAPTNLLSLLRDGRLNVIVADDSEVNFSELRVTLLDAPTP